MDDGERARQYERFTRPPEANRFATALWQVQAARYRRNVRRTSASANRGAMRELEASIAELDELRAEWAAKVPAEPNAALEVAQAERSLHQLKAMWFWAYEAAAS